MLCERIARALLDHEAIVEGGVDVGLGDRNPVDQAPPVLLGREDRGAAAVRYARSDHDGVPGPEPVGVREPLRADHLVQHEEGEADRFQHVAAPEPLRIVLGMRVLEGEAKGRLRVEAGLLAGADRGGEVGRIAGGIRLRALAADQVDGILRQVVSPGAGALVGIGDGAAALQSPFAGSADGAVDAARARGSARHDARLFGAEGERHLDHHRDVVGSAAVAEREELVAEDQFVDRVARLQRHAGAIKTAVAAGGGRVDQGPRVVVDRDRAQLLGGRRQGIGRLRRGRRLDPRDAEAGGQQIASARLVVGRAQHRLTPVLQGPRLVRRYRGHGDHDHRSDDGDRSHRPSCVRSHRRLPPKFCSRER